jgi:hypothetical protein
MTFRIYTNDYMSKLDEKIADLRFLDYFEDGFFKDEDAETYEYEIEDCDDEHINLTSQRGNYIDNAIALFETYKLSRVEASNRGFWTYLSLNKFAKYNKTLFNINKDVKNKQDYIYDHYVLGKSPSAMMRHTLCGLWWGVKLSIDETRLDKYELAEILFKQYSFFSRFLGINLVALESALHGMLEFMAEHKELFSHSFESRMRIMSIIVNRLGGTKLICAMDAQFFKNELEKRIDFIKKAESREALRTLI